MEAHSFSQEFKTYGLVLAGLLALTVVTVGAASFDFGAANVVVALLIASAKASLVALYFMHLRYDKPINAVIFLVGVFMLALFLVLTLIDVGTRETFRPANLAPPAGASVVAPAPTESAGDAEQPAGH